MRLAASLPKGLFCVRTIVDFSEVRLQWIFAPNATETSSSTSSVEHSNDYIAKLAEVSEPAFQLTNQAELEGLPGSSNGESGQAEGQERAKQVPTRCNCCKKRVGLTGFNCRCGNTFCSLHRYSDKHNCPFDYRAAGRAAIEKANPVVKAEKVDKF